MKVAIHQPNLFPRLKVLQKLSSADIWVVLDDVQYVKRDWQNRAKILPINKKNEEFWLSLCINKVNGRSTLIKDAIVLRLDQTILKIEESIRHSYNSSSHWDYINNYWNSVKEKINSEQLLDIALHSTIVALKQFGKLPQIIFSSDLNIDYKRSAKIVGISKALNANIYLSDSGALRYLDTSLFEETEILWQHWSPPIKSNFQWRNYSFLSFLAKDGPFKLKEHIQSGIFKPFPMKGDLISIHNNNKRNNNEEFNTV